MKLRGNPDHPFTRGALCAKLNNYVEYTAHPDRLMTPLRRVGAKGKSRFERISWSEALDEIAFRFSRIIERHGAEAIWPYLGCGSYGILQGLFGGGKRFWNALGASNHVVTICTITGCVGTGYTLGDRRVGMDPETMGHSKLIILWGTNTLTTNMHLWRSITTARDNGAHVVVIDPVRTRTAEAADEHLAPVPGTDAALALGLMHVVVASGAEDREFIAQHTLGWEAFRARIMEYPPARVAEITGLREEQIVNLGQRLALSRPTGIRTMMGIQRHGGGGMAVRTITCIAGVTGDWRYPGGGVSYDTRGFFHANWAKFLREDLRPKPVRSLSMTRLGEGLLEVNDPPVMGLFVHAANPLASAPDVNKIRKGLEREDLLTIVFDHFLTDTARYADIVLPSTAQFEHADIHNAYGHMYVSWNEPAVQPPGECMSATELFRRLAKRMNLHDPCLAASDEELATDLLSSDHPSIEGMTLEALKKKGWMRLNYPEDSALFSTGFMTPSGRLEFVSEQMAKDGLDPVAGYTEPHEITQQGTRLAEQYPLTLIAHARHYSVNSIFLNSPIHVRRQGLPLILIHPDDAQPRGLKSGMMCRVYNDRGEFRIPVEVSDKVRRGVLSTVKCGWPGLDAQGSTVNATVSERDSDMGGGATFHDNRVEIAAISATAA